MKLTSGKNLADLGRVAVVNIGSGPFYHGMRIGSGPIVSLEEAARQLHPLKITVGGREIRAADFPLRPIEPGTLPIYFTPFHFPPTRPALALLEAIQAL